jgi:hypothetical protein
MRRFLGVRRQGLESRAACRRLRSSRKRPRSSKSSAGQPARHERGAQRRSSTPNLLITSPVGLGTKYGKNQCMTWDHVGSSRIRAPPIGAVPVPKLTQPLRSAGTS